ncbi:MAG TPA: sigma-54 dependent transcriptional regulator [Brumimicrobium sp.]|nr:sigma-54 dependent transcriptional regulator [Brumimicrobium sp.]
MAKHTLLIIDDDVDICMLLKRFFERKGYHVRIAFKGYEGIEIVKKEAIDLVLTDFRLPDKDGFEIIEEIKAINDKLPIIVITGYSDVNQAVKVIRLGAYEYVTKPIFPEEIFMLVEDALKAKRKSKIEVAEDNAVSPSIPKMAKTNDEFLVPTSPYSQGIQRLVDIISPTNMTVVITGESGTGKEVVARMIHDASSRKSGPFIPVDCGALPQELASSELFGHVRGAFTGATSDKKGSFELANGGTLFLDEIGNLSYENQVKLLRVLQERVIRKVGSEKDMAVDVRIVVATNEDLKLAMHKGTFREDIYYRVNEFKIELKPLRKNKEELSDFIQFFLQKSNEELSKSVEGIDEDALEVLYNYPWPGNIRELKNTIKRAVLLSESNKIALKDLPQDIVNPKRMSWNKNNGSNVDNTETNSLLLKDVTAEAEKKAILKVLSILNNNKTKAAEILGIDRKTLYNKLNAYGLLEE